jgi:two-component system sensor histidine kinase KdpD
MFDRMPLPLLWRTLRPPRDGGHRLSWFARRHIARTASILVRISALGEAKGIPPGQTQLGTVQTEAPRAGGWKLYLLACLLVAAATIVSALWLRFLEPRNLSLPYIAALMLAGTWFGVRPAIAAAFIAFFSYNFFLVKPQFGLTFAPADLLALATFLATALLVGGMAGRLSDRARSAKERLVHLAALLSASRDLSAAGTPAEVACNLVSRLKAEAGVESAVWAPGESGSLLAASAGAQAAATQIQPTGQAMQGADAGCRWVPMATARGIIGTAAIWSGEQRAGATEQHWIDAILQLGAIALDRAALAGEISEAKLVAEKEGLRTALLSSLSHDLRTPIATILASASSLSANDSQFGPAARLELAGEIEAEAERLNLYVSNLLEMTRLESGALDLKLTQVDPCEAMAAALERMRRRLAGRRVVRRFENRGWTVLADPILFEQILVNIIENAASFSPPESEITASVLVEGKEAVLSITDSGPGVPASELPLVFEKFFRGRADRTRRAGVGLGLPVARGLAEAFSGRIIIESPVKEGRGTRMTVRLPVARPIEVCE